MRRVLEILLALVELGIAGFFAAMMRGQLRPPLTYDSTMDFGEFLASRVVPFALLGTALCLVLGQRRVASLCHYLLAAFCLIEVLLVLKCYTVYAFPTFLGMAAVGTVLLAICLFLVRWLR